MTYRVNLVCVNMVQTKNSDELSSQGRDIGGCRGVHGGRGGRGIGSKGLIVKVKLEVLFHASGFGNPEVVWHAFACHMADLEARFGACISNNGGPTTTTVGTPRFISRVRPVGYKDDVSN